MTDDHAAFEKNADRAEALIRIFERGRSRGRPKAEDTQLTRSSLVFSIGALDAYLHDVVLSVVAEFVPQSDELDRVVKEMQPHDLVQAMARASSHDDARERFRNHLDEYFDDKSFMDVHGLSRALRLVGCGLNVGDVTAKAGRVRLAADLGRYTDMRHRIVHRGENVRVTKDMAWDCAALVRAIVATVDQAIVDKYHSV